MKITSIKKRGRKYCLKLDDDFKVNAYEDVILNNGLLFRDQIDLDLIKKINIDNQYYDAYYKVINFIAHKLRSEKEVNTYMDKLDIDNKSKTIIINKLKQLNLINNIKFAKAYISDRMCLSNDGPLKIKKELLSHDIEENIIDNLLLEITDDVIINKIKKIITKKVKTTNYTGYLLKQKIVEYLINLGFDLNIITDIYNDMNIEKSGLIEKEYLKIKKKLINKYSDKELNFQIKKRLYQKGFNTDEINNILD